MGNGRILLVDTTRYKLIFYHINTTQYLSKATENCSVAVYHLKNIIKYNKKSCNFTYDLMQM